MKKNLIQRSMPIFEGKKVFNIGIKVNKRQQDELQRICDELDRPMSYIVRELAMRGLASYYRDGFIRMTADDEKTILIKQAELKRLTINNTVQTPDAGFDIIGVEAPPTAFEPTIDELKDEKEKAA